MQKIVTFLWFNDQAKEAVDLYVSLFENAKIINTSYLTESVAKAAGKKPGDLSTIDFELNGQNFTALNGGPMFTFSEAISILVYCKTQEEIDKLWDALSEGGEILSCGWLKDKYGVTWQITPESLDIMMRDPDTAKADRVSAAMLSMDGKLNISELEKAYNNASSGWGCFRCYVVATPLYAPKSVILINYAWSYAFLQIGDNIFCILSIACIHRPFFGTGRPSARPLLGTICQINQTYP